MNRIGLSKTEFFIGISLLFFYLAALWALLTRRHSLLLVFFVLHGCLVLLFFLAGQNHFVRILLRSREDTPSPHDRERRLLLQHTQEIDRLKQEHSALMTEKESLRAELGQWKDRCAAQNAADKPVHESFLPAREMRTDVDMAALAQDIVEEMLPRSRRAGIRLALSCCGGSLFCHGDASLLRLMFRTVIDNSLKYMNRSGSLIITLSGLGETVLAVLKDDGEGLPPQEDARIFDLNYQGSNRAGGTGLGLAQVKAIVTHYGGTVYAKSESGAGMAVYIQLPSAARADSV